MSGRARVEVDFDEWVEARRVEAQRWYRSLMRRNGGRVPKVIVRCDGHPVGGQEKKPPVARATLRPDGWYLEHIKAGRGANQTLMRTELLPGELVFAGDPEWRSDHIDIRAAAPPSRIRARTLRNRPVIACICGVRLVTSDFAELQEVFDGAVARDVHTMTIDEIRSELKRRRANAAWCADSARRARI